jgi:hypothetical protein
MNQQYSTNLNDYSFLIEGNSWNNMPLRFIENSKLKEHLIDMQIEAEFGDKMNRVKSCETKYNDYGSILIPKLEEYTYIVEAHTVEASDLENNNEDADIEF